MRPLIFIALGLGGCASTSAVMDREPIEIIRSAKAAEAIVFCLQNKTGAPAADLNGSKVILHKGVYGGLIASYSVRPESAGSIVEIRKGTAARAPKWRDCY